MTDRRIYRLTFRDRRINHTATIGIDYNREPVFAIFESSQLYFVCTPHRGVVHNVPYMVGADEVVSIEYFA